MSLGTLNASGVDTTLKDLNFHNHDNIIGSRNVQFSEGILGGLAGHIYNPAQCDLGKKHRHVIASMLTSLNEFDGLRFADNK
jgi:hypothetical protein